MKKIAFLLLSLSFAIPSLLYSQSPSYNITLQIDGLKDTTVFLAYYNGEGTYVKDTAHVNTSGSFRFEGEAPLPQGVYFLAMGKPRPTRLTDFVIGHTQTFSMRTDTADYIRHMKVSGDVDNKLFFENMRFNMDKNHEIAPFFKTIQDSSSSEEKRTKAREEIKRVNEKFSPIRTELSVNTLRPLQHGYLKQTGQFNSLNHLKEKTEASIPVFS